MDRDAFRQFVRRWLKKVADSAPTGRPVIVGLSAPQGSGKTTLSGELCALLADDGIRAVSISIDDFYLTHAEQIDLAERHPTNPYLQQRGLPGTHDIVLGTETLKALKNIGPQESVPLPSYDRTAYDGRGDRRPHDDWPVATAPLDLIIVEGWMLGFLPVKSEILADPNLREINGLLSGYADWHALLDAFIWVEPEDYEFVRTWRSEAEEHSRRQGHAGMTPKQVSTFVERFLPAYSIYAPALRRGSPVSGPYLHVRIGRDRLPTEEPSGQRPV